MGLYFGYPDPSCACNCETCAGILCIRVAGCLHFFGAGDATVAIKPHGSGTTVASGATDATGRFCTTLPASGSYDVTVTPAIAGYDPGTGTITYSCAVNQNQTFTLSPSAGWQCCSSGSGAFPNQFIPPTLLHIFSSLSGTTAGVNNTVGQPCLWDDTGAGLQVVYNGNGTWSVNVLSSVAGGPCSVTIPGPATPPVNLTFTNSGSPCPTGTPAGNIFPVHVFT